MYEPIYSASRSLPAATIESLKIMAARLRRDSLISTAEAGSGHPSSCLSCADLLAVLFFEFLRFDVRQPGNLANDRLILSKGHAAPILWSLWAEAGAFPIEHLKTLRRFDSDLEGHPTPRSPYVDLATGSLGQGLSDGVGMAIGMRLNQTANRAWVLLGDGEVAEGSVWEAAELASFYQLDNLVAILDANRFGQSRETMYGHDLAVYEQRFRAFGWHTRIIDGHNIDEIIGAYEEAVEVKNQPSIVIARTIKGQGVSLIADKPGWHGKPLKKGEQLDQALAEVNGDREPPEPLTIQPPVTDGMTALKAGALPLGDVPAGLANQMAPPDYQPGDKTATREAYGKGLRKLGAVLPAVVALDGDVQNSTYTEYFSDSYPERFTECYIAEQNMTGVAMGLAALGRIPFAATFACFTTRAFDQLRMAGISNSNIKLCGSHAGVSIGEDGPSQMGLEDIAMTRALQGSTVLYPADGVCTERCVALAAETPGIVYIRTARPKTPILYDANEPFRVGGCKVLRSSAGDVATVVTAGITLPEALQAYDLLKKEGISIRIIDLYSVKPLDAETLRQAARETGHIVTVEDHYPAGGIGEAVLSTLANENCQFRMLAVDGPPRSGKAEELLAHFHLDANGITQAVRELVRTT